MVDLRLPTLLKDILLVMKAENHIGDFWPILGEPFFGLRPMPNGTYVLIWN